MSITVFTHLNTVMAQWLRLWPGVQIPTSAQLDLVSILSHFGKTYQTNEQNLITACSVSKVMARCSVPDGQGLGSLLRKLWWVDKHQFEQQL